MRPKPRPRIFLDTNVIFSGLYSSVGSPARIIDLLVDGRLEVVISQQVLEEVVRAFKQKLPSKLVALSTLLVNSRLEIRKDPSREEVVRWTELMNADDATILAAAIAAQPDYLVTGDKHFLDHPEVSEQTGLPIVSPAHFVRRLEDESETV